VALMVNVDCNKIVPAFSPIVVTAVLQKQKVERYLLKHFSPYALIAILLQVQVYCCQVTDTTVLVRNNHFVVYFGKFYVSIYILFSEQLF
jgi:hypothetical protein